MARDLRGDDVGIPARRGIGANPRRWRGRESNSHDVGWCFPGTALLGATQRDSGSAARRPHDSMIRE